MGSAVAEVRLSNSEYRTWLGCPRLWLYSYGLRLEPTERAAALWIGSTVHDALACWYRAAKETGLLPPVELMDLIMFGPASDNVQAFPGAKLRDGLEESEGRSIPWVMRHAFDGQLSLDGEIEPTALRDALSRWGVPAFPARDLRGDPIQPPLLGTGRIPVVGVLGEQRVLGHRALTQPSSVGRGGVAFTEANLQRDLDLMFDMLSGYVDEYPDDADAWEILIVEERLDAPIKTPQGHTARRKRATGKLDLAVRHRGDGRIRIVDHKTTSESDLLAKAMARYQIDTQARGYMYLAEHNLGQRPVAMVYNFLRKDRPRRPKFAGCSRSHKGLTRPCSGCGTLDGKGPDGKKARAVSTATKNLLEHELREAIAEVGGDPLRDEKYQQLLASAARNRFYYREERFVSQDELDEHARESYTVALRISRARAFLDKELPTPDERARPCPMSVRARFPRNPGKCYDYNRLCSFAPLCMADTPEARREFITRDTMLPNP